MVVPERGGAARSYKITRRQIRAVIVVAAVLLLVSSAVAVHQAFLWVRLGGESSRNDNLAMENEELRALVDGVELRIDNIGDSLHEVERLDARIRSITLLSDPDRHLEIGPLPDTDGVRGASETGDSLDALPGLNDREVKLVRLSRLEVLDLRAEVVAAEAKERAHSMKALEDYFRGRESILASTPSTWPVHGYVTSRFGPRINSLTGERRVHPGMDISTPIGTAVRSTADGRITFVGEDGGYGKMVLVDHGHGMTTKYAHLSDHKVELNQKVKRGDIIALTGNTGRSTGPHLHYEVRLYGVPENPYHYILD